MQKTSTIQYIILAVFIVFLLIGVLVFAGFTATNSNNSQSVPIIIWGVLPATYFTDTITKLQVSNPALMNISYQQVPLDKFDSELVNAVAEGQAPDMVILPQNDIYKESKLLSLIPYTVFPQGTFENTFATVGNVFLTDNGIQAIPFVVDPLVLYWNKDIFANAGLPLPPTKWSGLTTLVPKLSKISSDKTISQSTVSFGEYTNVPNASAILSCLAFQAGNPITQFQSGTLVSVVEGNQEDAFESALSFYTEFANPSSVDYSWNRSLPNSDQMFLLGQSATYIGFASEYANLQAENPNLNFGVAVIPQADNSNTSVTYANVYGIGILASSKNQNAAFSQAQSLVGNAFLTVFSTESGIPSVRNDMLSAVEPSASAETFRRSVLISKTWIDPDEADTDTAIQTMIESVTSGSSDVLDAVSGFNSNLQEFLK